MVGLISVLSLVEAVILASSLSMDAFAASFAYGSNKIKIPMLSVQIINIVCSSILGISLFLGAVVRQYLPGRVTVISCFVILFALGMAKLLDSITKTIIRKHTDINKEIKFSMLNFKFILKLYADPELADVDASKSISPMEAAALSVSLSLDGMAIGFGAALGSVNVLGVFLISFVTNVLAVILGCYIGNKLASKISFNLSWLSGAVLIILAAVKLF